MLTGDIVQHVALFRFKLLMHFLALIQLPGCGRVVAHIFIYSSVYMYYIANFQLFLSIIIIISSYRCMVQRRSRQRPTKSPNIIYDELASTHNLLPSCLRNRRYLKSLGCWACPGNWQTGHINHWRTQRIHLCFSSCQ